MGKEIGRKMNLVSEFLDSRYLRDIYKGTCPRTCSKSGQKIKTVWYLKFGRAKGRAQGPNKSREV